jgi:hypothetical protein
MVRIFLQQIIIFRLFSWTVCQSLIQEGKEETAHFVSVLAPLTPQRSSPEHEGRHPGDRTFCIGSKDAWPFSTVVRTDGVY